MQFIPMKKSNRLTFYCESIVLTCCFVFSQFCSAQELEAPKLSSPQSTFKHFCKIHNAGQFSELLAITSPKAKAGFLGGHILQMGLLPASKTDRFDIVTTKWKPAIEKQFKGSIKEAEDYTPFILALAEWKQLDDYLQEVLEISKHDARPIYSNELTNLTVDDGRAKATVKIKTNKGYIGRIDGNPLQLYDAGTVTVYFRKLNDTWLISSELEWQGELDK